MSITKTELLEALRAFINSRPGFEACNYATRADMARDQREATRDRNIARRLLADVALRDSITAEHILAAGKRGRLSIKVESVPMQNSGYYGLSESAGLAHRVVVDYCTGQYYCVEYRAGVCRLLASLIWDDVREHYMPRPVRKPDGRETYAGLSGGDWIRRHFRRTYGPSIASRFFD